MNRKALTAGVVLAAATGSPSRPRPLRPASHSSWVRTPTRGARTARTADAMSAWTWRSWTRRRPPRTSGTPELYAHDNYLLTHHHIGADGSWWTRLNGNFRIASIAQVGPTTWRIVQQDAGRTWNLTSESGKSVWADQGLGRFTSRSTRSGTTTLRTTNGVSLATSSTDRPSLGTTSLEASCATSSTKPWPSAEIRHSSSFWRHGQTGCCSRPGNSSAHSSGVKSRPTSVQAKSSARVVDRDQT